MQQTRDELERFYEKVDPWGYTTNPDDAFRKARIIEACQAQPNLYDVAIDIGCGEGWITKDLPARKIYGYELSETAKLRFPDNVLPLPLSTSIAGGADLIISTGTMYAQYDWMHMLEVLLALKSEKTRVVLCNIAEWEVPEIAMLGEPTFVEHFPYREYTQRLRIYEPTKNS